MKEYRGYRLYVNLGPSRVRRRLRGHGFGVKVVQSAGTDRALIIHTATGSQRKRLERLFVDVLPRVPANGVFDKENPLETTPDGLRPSNGNAPDRRN